MLPLPLSSLLVPMPEVAAPPGFDVVTRNIATGLPLVCTIGGGFEVLVVLPTGLARQWIDADPGGVVASSEDELQPLDAAALSPGTFSRAPARWIVRRGGRVVAALPFNLGVVRRVSEAGLADSGVALELIALQWTLHAGSVRGAGDFGSRVAFAWRLADVAADQFGTPLVSRRVLARKPLDQRLQSIILTPIPRRLLVAEKLTWRAFG